MVTRWIGNDTPLDEREDPWDLCANWPLHVSPDGGRHDLPAAAPCVRRDPLVPFQRPRGRGFPGPLSGSASPRSTTPGDGRACTRSAPPCARTRSSSGKEAPQDTYTNV